MIILFWPSEPMILMRYLNILRVDFFIKMILPDLKIFYAFDHVLIL